MVEELDIARVELVERELDPVDVALSLAEVLVVSVFELEVFPI